MNSLLVVAITVVLVLALAAAGILLANFWRDKRRAALEDAVAKAAQDYLARFEVRARIVAVTLPDNHIALMVETPPHKKLRFSFIIEQPIKQYVLKQTQVEVDRIFWRFPLPPKASQMPEVQYGCPTTQVMPAPQAAAPAMAAPSDAGSVAATQDNEDDYFLRQAYQIEEVSWEDFSNILKPDSGTGPPKK